MNILIIAEKKAKVKPFLTALKQKGVKADYLRISKITLVGKHGQTLIKCLGKELPAYDAVFIQARTSLAPFVEPLLEELQKIKSYTNIKRDAYYIGANEPYKFTTLALRNIPTPKTISTISKKNIELCAKKISYPIIVKTFLELKPQQSIVINNNKELTSFVKSIKTDFSAFLIKEFIIGDIISCIVIGERVIAVKRKKINDEPVKIEKGTLYYPTTHEKEIAINAANACGYEIARVDIINEVVIKVDPIIPLDEFNSALSASIEEGIANFLIEKSKQHENLIQAPYDLLGLKKLFSKTILKRFFK